MSSSFLETHKIFNLIKVQLDVLYLHFQMKNVFKSIPFVKHEVFNNKILLSSKVQLYIYIHIYLTGLNVYLYVPDCMLIYEICCQCKHLIQSIIKGYIENRATNVFMKTDYN